MEIQDLVSLWFGREGKRRKKHKLNLTKILNPGNHEQDGRNEQIRSGKDKELDFRLDDKMLANIFKRKSKKLAMEEQSLRERGQNTN